MLLQSFIFVFIKISSNFNFNQLLTFKINCCLFFLLLMFHNVLIWRMYSKYEKSLCRCSLCETFTFFVVVNISIKKIKILCPNIKLFFYLVNFYWHFNTRITFVYYVRDNWRVTVCWNCQKMQNIIFMKQFGNTT